MTVYIDQYIITNTILNFIILRITKTVIKSKSSNPRLLVSSVAGALFAILMLFPQARHITGFLGKIIFSLILTAISFNSRTFKMFLKNLVVFYFVSFTIGGCGYAIYNIFGISKHFDTARLLCLTVFVSYIIFSTVSSVYEKYFKYDHLIHTLKITVGEKNIKTKCFYDTGNSLCDPITKTPVIVTNIETVKPLLPDCIINDILHNVDRVKIFFSYHTDLRLKLIPYSTISDNGFILGFTPSSVFIDNRKVNAIIGISAIAVSSDKEYSAILNPQLI